MCLVSPALGQGGYPAAPSDVEAFNLGDGQRAYLRWTDNSNNESGFQILRERDEDGQWVEPVWLPEADPNHANYTDECGSGTFRYQVRATNIVGASEFAPEVQVSVFQATPAVPSDLAFQDLGDGLRAQLTWTDRSHNETGFELLREKRNTAGLWGGTVTLACASNTTVMNNMPGVGAYRYRIRSVNSAGGSAWSPWVEGSVLAVPGVSPPAAPSNEGAFNLGTGLHAWVRWDDNANNENGYTIQREEQAGSGWENTTTINRPADSTSFTDASGAGTFRYRVRSVNGAGISAWTPWAEASIGLNSPTVPSDLSFDDLEDGLRARISWSDRSINESGFEVRREKQNSSGGWFGTTTLAASANVTAINNMPGPGTYRVRIRSVNSAGASAWSSWVTGTVLARPPAVPSGLTVLDLGNGSQARVTWVDESLNETGFELERQTLSGSAWGPSAVTPLSANTTQQTLAVGQATHRYRIRSVNAAGPSAFTAWVQSVVASPLPNAPTAMTLNDMGNGVQARLVWQDNSSNEAAFEIERQTQSGANWIGLISLNASANVNQHVDGPGLGTYRYRLRAVNTYGVSGWTPWGTVTVTSQIPAAPTGLSATDMGNGSQVRLAWQDNSNNETVFQIERQTQSGSTWGASAALSAATNATQHLDAPGIGTFRYRIRSVNAQGASGYTAWATITVQSQAPSAPTGLNAVDAGNRKAMLSWTDTSSNETSFQIERQPAFATGQISVSANVTGYLDSSGAGTFHYRVRASNSSGPSVWTAWKQVVIADIPPAAPSGVSVIDLGTLSTVRVSWIDNSDNETGFQIERQTLSGSTWGGGVTITSGANTTSKDDNAGMGTHRYRIRAVNSVGSSAYSAWANVTLAAGWTVFTASPDTRKVYVSSTGNDSNTGLSEAAPKKTIAAAAALMRNGYPDWMLLKRGDVWTNETISWGKSGRSSSEPMLIGTYGTSPNRPLLRTGSSGGFFWTPPGGTGSLNHVAVVGLHFTPHTYSGTANYPAGISFIGGGDNFLLEDCVVEKYSANVVIQSWNGGRPKNARVRRCVIADAYVVGTSPHAEGMYLDGIDGLIVEECVLDHNGWREDIPGAVQTVFRHNVYIQSNCTNTTFRRNIVTNGGATGVQCRSGGVCDDNVFVRNPVNVVFGGGDDPYPGGVTGTVKGNVILRSNPLAGEGRGYGIIVENVSAQGITIDSNIIAHDENPSNQQAIGIWPNKGVGVLKATVKNNVMYKWKTDVNIGQPSNGAQLGNVTFTGNILQEPSASSEWLISYMPSSVSSSMMTCNGNRYFSGRPASSWFGIGYNPKSHPQWVAATNEIGSQSGLVPLPDPNRDVATYHASLGQVASLDAFLTEARKQSKANWRTEYTAQAVLGYLRQGYMQNP